MKITVTPNIYSDTSDAFDATFDQLCGLFLKRLQYDGHKEGNMMFIMGELKGDILAGNKINRCDENVISMSALVFDIDNKAGVAITDPFKFAADLGHKVLLASTASSTREFPRARIVMPATRAMTVEDFRRIQTALFDAFKREHPALDPDMKRPSQAYYMPQQPTDKVDGYGFVEVIDGPLFDPDAYLKRLRPEPKKRKAPLKKSVGYDPLTLDQALEALSFFNAGDDKDRFMTCLVFIKNFPLSESFWQSWHEAGSTKSAKRNNFWAKQKNSERGSKYDAVNVGWFIKEAKSRGWRGPQADGGTKAKP
jgi:hypothetical protein